jgi:hypothetical protein
MQNQDLQIAMAIDNVLNSVSRIEAVHVPKVIWRTTL